MELHLNSGKYQTTFDSADVKISLEKGSGLNLVIGPEVKIDVERTISYVQSGKAEIEAATQTEIIAFNTNAEEKIFFFNNNAENCLSAYNANTDNRLEEYNNNAIDKTASFDSHAASSIAQAEYWARQSESSLSTVRERIEDIEQKIPSSATISNQLIDKGYVDTALEGKQNTLASAINIKTIHGESILGSGDLRISLRNIGEIIQSTIPLSDAGLHLLDGALINGTGSYSAFVTYIAGLVSNYPDLFITETAWQQAVTDYGVCGKFVYDSTNNTVRLPKITGFTEGTTDVTALGDLVEAGLPNIEGNFYPRNTGYGTYWDNDSYEGGALYKLSLVGDTTRQAQNTSGNYTTSVALGLDASRSNPIYGNSSTVQPQSIKVLYYIVIANSVKTNIEVDIDEIATDLNGKADVDLSNVNVSGTSLASGWSMPSSRYISLAWGASGSTYTAPANGWFYARARSKGTTKITYISLVNETTLLTTSSLVYLPNTSSQYTIHTYMPVKKGQTVDLNYDLASTVDNNVIRFIYAEGEKNV